MHRHGQCELVHGAPQPPGGLQRHPRVRGPPHRGPHHQHGLQDDPDADHERHVPADRARPRTMWRAALPSAQWRSKLLGATIPCKKFYFDFHINLLYWKTGSFSSDLSWRILRGESPSKQSRPCTCLPLADVVVSQPEVPAGERPEATGGRDHPDQVSAAGQDGPRHACADGSHGNVRR